MKFTNSLDIAGLIRELRTGLARLTFSENFRTFTVEVSIAAGTEERISNGFRDGIIPSGWIAIRKNEDGALVHDDGTAWSSNFVYLTNPGASTATLTVIFFK